MIIAKTHSTALMPKINTRGPHVEMCLKCMQFMEPKCTTLCVKRNTRNLQTNKMEIKRIPSSLKRAKSL